MYRVWLGLQNRSGVTKRPAAVKNRTLYSPVTTAISRNLGQGDISISNINVIRLEQGLQNPWICRIRNSFYVIKKLWSVDTHSRSVSNSCVVCNVYNNFFIVAPPLLIYVEFTHQQMHYFYFKEHIKIYIKIHINIAPTCFGLRPSSGSLH